MSKLVSTIQVFMPIFMLVGVAISISAIFSTIYVRKKFKNFNFNKPLCRVLRAQICSVNYV